MAQVLANCLAIAPELTIIAAMAAVILIDLAVLSRKSTHLSGWIAIAGLAAAFLQLCKWDPTTAGAEFFSGAIRLDPLAIIFQKMIVLGAICVCLFSLVSRELHGRRLGEFFALILSATLGSMFLAAANDFLILILAVETLSLSSYVLAGYLRNDRKAAEASIKYVLYGAVASGIMVFGFSYIYGITGSLRLTHAFAALAGETPLIFYAAFVMVLTGIGFKISAVPFHNWTPDVYEGSPTSVTAFLAVVSKSAGFAILIRLVFQAGSAGCDYDLTAGAQILSDAGLDIFFWVLAAATMTVGNLVALRQTNIKRLLGYSSIAHAGYILMVFTVFDTAAWEAAIFYFIVYYIMTLGAFYIAIVLENNLGSVEMRDCRGMWIASPFLVVGMVIFLVSLTGLPPMAGFAGKLQVFKVLVDAALGESARAPIFYWSLALIGVVNSVISLYYYMKIVRAMAFEKHEALPEIQLRLPDFVYVVAFAAAVLFLGLYFQPIFDIVEGIFESPAAAIVTGGL